MEEIKTPNGPIHLPTRISFKEMMRRGVAKKLETFPGEYYEFPYIIQITDNRQGIVLYHKDNLPELMKKQLANEK